jgi:hypothetical protein
MNSTFGLFSKILPHFLDYSFGITLRVLNMNVLLYIARSVPMNTVKFFLSFLLIFATYVLIWIKLKGGIYKYVIGIML